MESVLDSGLETPKSANSLRRVVSVDVLRGLTILLMVFVNDLGPAAPAWMHHIQPPNADGMTLADIVFPFFLFIAGASIPLAFEAARRKGQSNWRILFHIFSRTLALLLMGLVEVNRYSETTLGPDLWGLLAFIAIIFAWCVVPNENTTRRKLMIGLKVAGVIGLLLLLAVYRSAPVATNVLFLGEVESWTWLRTQWWGILGLIGWSYLTCALIFFFVGSRREWLIGAVAILMLNFVAASNGGFFTRVEDKNWLEPMMMPLVNAVRGVVDFIYRFVDIGSQLGSLPATMMAGCVLGTLLTRGSEIKDHSERIRWATVFALGLFLAGAMTDTFGGINKISATPTWCFWCASLATVVWILLYLILDVRQWQLWSKLVAPAGANPLIAYLLHPILLFIFSLTGLGVTLRSYSASEAGWVAVLGSLAMAVVICALTALIAKIGLRIRV